MKDRIIFKNKKNTLIFIFIALIVLFFLRPKTPQEQAIAKYIKETNGNSYTLAMIVKESDFIDPYPKYGRLYHVWGVIGDFAGVNFFYLYEDSDGWKVDKCGTGP